MTEAAESTAEAAVRKFLEFVSDPASARDETLISSLRDDVASAGDPIKKLKLLAALDRAEKADGEALRHGFVMHARLWADQEGIPLRAFRELGVNDIVLAEAGFDMGMGRAAKGKGGGSAQGSRHRVESTGSAAPRARAKSISADEIRHWMLEQSGPFTLAQTMTGAGGSLGTITKVADELVGTGQIKKLGPSPTHSGRGRAPYQYERA